MFYTTFKELFGSINVDSLKEALPKVSIYNDTIARFVEEINSKYGMALTFTHLEPCEVGHWAETFQVAKGNNEGPKLLQPWQLCQESIEQESYSPYNHNQSEPTQQPQYKQSQQPVLQPQPARKISSPHHKSRHNRQR